MGNKIRIDTMKRTVIVIAVAAILISAKCFAGIKVYGDGGYYFTLSADSEMTEVLDFNWPAIDGAASQALVTDGYGSLSFVDVNAVAGTHNLLAVTHPDAVGAAVTAGDLIYGNSTPKWDALGAGSENDILRMSGGFPDWTDAPTLGSLTLTDNIPLTLSNYANYKLLRFDATGRMLPVDEELEDYIKGSNNITATNSGTCQITISGALLLPYTGANANLQLGTNSLTFANNYGQTFTLGTGVAGNVYFGSTGNNLSFSPATNGGESLGETNYRWNAGLIDNLWTTNIGTTAGDLSITAAGGDITFDNENLATTGTITGVNVTSGADPGHTHTGSSLGSIDISGDTNLAAGTNITLVDDTLNVDDAFLVNDANDETTGSLKINTSSTTALFVENNGTKDDVFIVDTVNSGVGIGVGAAGTAKLIIGGTHTEPTPKWGLYSNLSIVLGGNSSSDFMGIEGRLNTGAAAGTGRTYSGKIYGLRGNIQHTDLSGGGDTVSNIYAIDSTGYFGSFNGSLTNLVGIHAGITSFGTVTNKYGLLIDNVSGATSLNYAI